MKNQQLIDFARRNPVRVQAIVTSIFLIASAFFADFPAEAVATLVLSTLGLGEFAQRYEDFKTEAALHTDPAPEAEAETE